MVERCPRCGKIKVLTPESDFVKPKYGSPFTTIKGAGRKPTKRTK